MIAGHDGLGEGVRAVLLSGSHVWDRTSIESIRPRALLPVANTPVIDYALGWIRDAGIRNVVICSNQATAALQNHLGAGEQFGLDVRYFEDRIPRGPAGCVLDAAHMASGELSVVIDAAIIPSFDLHRVVDSHRVRDADLTECVDSTAHATAGIAEPVGVRIISDRVLPSIGGSGFQDIKEMLVPKLRRAAGRVFAYAVERDAPRVRGLRSYFAAQRWAIEQLRLGTVTFLDYDVSGDLIRHAESTVAASARLVGPIVIGPGAVVADNAVVVGPTVIGTDARVSERAVVTESVLWERATLAAGVTVTQSVVVSDAHLASDQSEYRTICW